MCPQAEETIYKLRGLQVLLVEDEHMIAMAVQEEIHDAGGNCFTANSLKSALYAAKFQHFHLAVVDAYLNGHMSIEVVKILVSKNIPFIVATGAFLRDLPRLFWAGHYLPKPFDTAQLMTAISLNSFKFPNADCPT